MATQPSTTLAVTPWTVKGSAVWNVVGAPRPLGDLAFTSMKRSAAVLLVAVTLVAGGCMFGKPGRDDHVRKAQQVVRDVNAGRFTEVRSHFDETMDAELSEARLRTLWTNFTNVKGELVSQGAPRVDMRGRITVVSIPVRMSKQAGQIRVSLNSDGKIAGLFFLQPNATVP